jgi:hypothetical protein
MRGDVAAALATDEKQWFGDVDQQTSDTRQQLRGGDGYG